MEVYLHCRTEANKLAKNEVFCGNSSVGRARPCQGRGREFESRFPLQEKRMLKKFNVLFSVIPPSNSNSRQLSGTQRSELLRWMSCQNPHNRKVAAVFGFTIRLAFHLLIVPSFQRKPYLWCTIFSKCLLRQFLYLLL